LATRPAISVVIPVYCHTEAHRRFLVEALESVAAQTFRDIEVVIVDDVSPIDITPVVESVADLPRTRILRNAANVGHAESRNIGIRAAEGELIAFLDHDDVWLAEKLERQVRVMSANPEAAMCFCDVEIMGSYPPGLYVDQSTIPERPDVVWFITHKNSVITVSAVLARRRAMLDIGLFDSRYTSCDDYDAWIKILMRGPIIHLPETLAKYRLHQHNANYSVNRLTDNRLLTSLIVSYWHTAPTREKLALLPTLGRKLAGRIVYALMGKWQDPVVLTSRSESV